MTEIPLAAAAASGSYALVPGRVRKVQPAVPGQVLTASDGATYAIGANNGLIRLDKQRTSKKARRKARARARLG